MWRQTWKRKTRKSLNFGSRQRGSDLGFAMFFQVFLRRLQDDDAILCVTECQVALSAEEPPNLPRRVVVVNVGMRRPDLQELPADGAGEVLLAQKGQESRPS